MTVNEYRDRLVMALSAFDQDEVASVVDYYTELIEDADDQEEQMMSLGSPEQLATKIIQENGWVKPEEEQQYSQGMNGFPPPPQNGFPPPPKASGWSAFRIIALVLTMPFWTAGYSLMAALFIVIAAVYFACTAASAASFVAAFKYIKQFVPFTIEMFFVALMMLGLTVLLFRPVKALFRGAAGLIADYSYFLFAPGHIRQKRRGMAPINKLAVIVGAALLVLGTSGAIFSEYNNNKRMDAYIQKMDLETFEQSLSGPTDNLSINAKIGSITVLPSTDGKAKLLCENVHREYLKIESDGRMKIRYNYDLMKSSPLSPKFGFGSINKYAEKTTPKFTLYLPEGQTSKIKVSASLGNIKLSGITATEMNIECNCGEVELSGCKAADLDLNNDLGENKIESCTFTDAKVIDHCGSIELSGTTCEGQMTVTDDLGDIKVNECTFKAVSVTDNCGDIDVSQTTFTAASAFQNDLGSCNIDLLGTDYAIMATTDLGDVRINGEEQTSTTGTIPVTINCSAGSITVTFK